MVKSNVQRAQCGCGNSVDRTAWDREDKQSQVNSLCDVVSDTVLEVKNTLKKYIFMFYIICLWHTLWFIVAHPVVRNLCGKEYKEFLYFLIRDISIYMLHPRNLLPQTLPCVCYVKYVCFSLRYVIL